MRLRHLLRLAILVGLLACISSPAWATCSFTGINFTQTTDLYVNQPASGQSPTTLYRVIDLSGTTAMSPSFCAPSQVKHFATTYNYFNGGGGSAQGAQVCVTCFTESHNVQTTPFVDELVTTSNDSGNVDCTLAGDFFNVAAVNYDLEIATTKSVQVGQSTRYPAYWKLSSWCSPASTPPDWNPNAILPKGGIVWPYYISLNICQRVAHSPVGTPWDCFSRAVNPLVYGETTSERPNCTNHDANLHTDIFVDGDYIQVIWIVVKTALNL